MICSKCGNEIADNAKFCRFCGAKAEPKKIEKTEKRICASCGAELKNHMKFCVSCGSAVESVKTDKRICSVCGEELSQNVKFCRKCGTKVESDAAIHESISKKNPRVKKEDTVKIQPAKEDTTKNRSVTEEVTTKNRPVKEKDTTKNRSVKEEVTTKNQPIKEENTTKKQRVKREDAAEKGQEKQNEPQKSSSKKDVVLNRQPEQTTRTSNVSRKRNVKQQSSMQIAKVPISKKRASRLTAISSAGEVDFGLIDLFGEAEESAFAGAVGEAAVQVTEKVRGLVPGVFHGLGSYIGGMFRIFKKPSALIGTVLLAVVWIVLGNLQYSGSSAVDFLSWLTFSQGGLGRGTLGMIGGIAGKGMVASGLLSLLNGGLPKAIKGIGALFVKHGEKRGFFTILFGIVLGFAGFLCFAGLDFQAESSMAGIAGALTSLESLGSGNGKLYELAQSITSGKRDGIRVAMPGKCHGLLVGLTLGFALGAGLSALV